MEAVTERKAGYLSLADAAQYLSISAQHLTRFVNMCAIPYVDMRFPGSAQRLVRFSKEALDEWAKGRMIGATRA